MIEDYIRTNQDKKPPADIVERWHSRVVALGLNAKGAAGAEHYLAKFGKGMKAPKAIGFARMAETQGCAEMANRFWEEAFFLDTGARARVTAGTASAPAISAPAPVTFAPSPVKQPFGQSPQLLVAVEESDLPRLIADDRYGFQEKVDGERAMVAAESGNVTAGNKKGLQRAVPFGARDFFAQYRDIVVDGEDENVVYHAFDLLRHEGTDLRPMPYQARFERLQSLLRFAPSDKLRVVPLVMGRAAKAAFVEQLRTAKAEGFVAKDLRAPYVPGERAGTQWKFQFRGLAAVVVGERNGVKNSVAIYTHRADGSRRDLGKVTIPQNAAIPEPGQVVEVQYLYCHPGAAGKLAQPVFKGVRTDVDPIDCRDSKLKVKRVEEDDLPAAESVEIAEASACVATGIGI